MVCAFEGVTKRKEKKADRRKRIFLPVHIQTNYEMGLLKKQWMEEAELNRQASSSGMNLERLYEPRRCEIYYKKSAEPGSPLFLFKHIFGSTAHGADPSVGKFFKGCARRDIPVRIALLGIVNITANLAFPFFHLSLLCQLEIKEGDGRGAQRIGVKIFFAYFNISSS